LLMLGILILIFGWHVVGRKDQEHDQDLERE
jgi:hypothetical protein